ncbi:MAG: dynamin family protein, partial [Deltaproteobacteria bacterium]|nr:dynamin family protein [Deltaproteobacteria bacterium]
ALRLIIRKAGSIDGLSNHPLEAWKATTDSIHRQLAEEMIRVAVVGSIKSGKSTLVNALFGGDYVKRGAGVVTSIVTKVRPGKSLRAELEFKTWDEINAEMSQALILFSATNGYADGSSFDINREKDRNQLQESLSGLNTEQLISNDTRDPNSLLLTEYLRGYDRVEQLVSFEPNTRVLKEGEFNRQKDFVGDESLAVYLKDVRLSLIAPEEFGENVEIADCQGSDSPNPLHLVMIQDYLVQAHFIIYVLSSRTGLRQADIKFLNIIKKMGLLKNIFFVLNCDFSEHEDLEGLRGLLERVRDELGMISPDPEVFTFSGLYNLFRYLEKDGALSRKDFLRLEQWREEADMAASSDQETDRFVKSVVDKISADRLHLLLETNLERISMMASSMGDWIQINHDLLSKEVIKDTLDGSTRKLKRDLGDDVERFFDFKYSETVQGIIQFVDSYSVSARDYEKDLETSGFLSTLYRIFQTLREATNRYIAESINPKLVDFVHLEEEKIKGVSDQVSGPYGLMIQDALDQYQRTAEKLGIKIEQRPFRPVKSPDMGMVKGDASLSIPPLVTTLRYSGRIKTEAILRLGMYNTLRAMRKLLRKRTGGELESAMRSLDDSVRRIKEQLRESIAAHLLDYKENLKYQYFFKLVDAVSDSLYETLVDRMRAFTGGLSDMSGLIENQHTAGDQMITEFVSLKKSVGAALDKVKEAERLLEGVSVSQYGKS